MSAALVIPQCLPGEFFSGALGRCAQLNGLSPDDVLRALVGDSLVWRSPDIIERLASAFGLSVDELIANHSIIPFMSRFDPPVNDDSNQRWNLRAATNSLIQSFYHFRLCPRCVDEDLKRRGYAVWRTLHQLPGMLWCLEHGCFLTETRLSPRHRSPADEPTLDRERGKSWVNTEGSVAPIIVRFTQVSQELLAIAPGPSGRLVLKRLRRRGIELGLRIRPKRDGRPSTSTPLLGEYARARPDSDAIAALMSRLSKSQICPWTALDRSLAWNGIKTGRLCLMACMLLDSVDSAISCLAGIATRTDENYEREVHRNDGEVQTSTLMRTYYRANGNYQQTARLLGRSPWAIRSALERRGLPNFKRTTNISTILALVDFCEGASLVEACIRYAADPAEVEYFLRFGRDAILKCAKQIKKGIEESERLA